MVIWYLSDAFCKNRSKDRLVLESVGDTETVGDDGYRRIRSDIIFGRLQPDQKLRLEALKEHYGVSISTLREILSRLSSEGFVVAEARRGFEVAPVSAKDLRELADLRILLESYAIEKSFERGDTEWEGRVVSAHHKLAVVEQRLGSSKRENALWKRYDEEFHQALISNCGSTALMEDHRRVFDRYFRYPMIWADRRGIEPIKQHRQLMESALDRDSKKAKTILVVHVNNCVEHAIAGAKLR
jgi:GntR family transcriptional regulator, carbon starvation induced regulator